MKIPLNPSRRKQRFPRWVIVCASIVFLDVLFTIGTIRLMEGEKPVWLKKESAAGLIFFRDFNSDHTDIGPDSKRRLNQILELYRTGTIQEIGCIGGARIGQQLYGSVFMKNHLVKAGVPLIAVWADQDSYDSRTNWQVARKLIQQRAWRHVFVVASPLHSRRLQSIISRDGIPGVEFSYAPYSYRQSHPSLTVWEAWREVHLETLAVLANTLIPAHMYPAVIKKWREIMP